jgi:hypothetical protein
MVSAAPREPTAVLVVSAWREGVPPRLVARITYTIDVTRRDRVTVTAAGVDEIGAVVRQWLHAAEASDRSGDTPVTDA